MTASTAERGGIAVNGNGGVRFRIGPAGEDYVIPEVTVLRIPCGGRRPFTTETEIMPSGEKGLDIDLAS